MHAYIRSCAAWPQWSYATCLSSEKAIEYLSTVLKNHQLIVPENAVPHDDTPSVMSELRPAVTALQKEMNKMTSESHADESTHAFLGEIYLILTPSPALVCAPESTELCYENAQVASARGFMKRAMSVPYPQTLSHSPKIALTHNCHIINT